MKKRKSPVLLLSLLLVLVGFVVVFGMSQGSSQKPQDPEQVTAQHGAPTPEEVAKSVSKSTSPVQMTHKQMRAQEEMSGPSIALHPNTQTFPRPKPSSAGSTDSQWYQH